MTRRFKKPIVIENIIKKCYNIHCIILDGKAIRRDKRA